MAEDIKSRVEATVNDPARLEARRQMEMQEVRNIGAARYGQDAFGDAITKVAAKIGNEKSFLFRELVLNHVGSGADTIMHLARNENQLEDIAKADNPVSMGAVLGDIERQRSPSGRVDHYPYPEHRKPPREREPANAAEAYQLTDEKRFDAWFRQNQEKRARERNPYAREGMRGTSINSAGRFGKRGDWE